MKPETHSQITKAAVAAFVIRRDTGLAEVLDNEVYRQCIQDGSVWEDAFGYDRLTNWHFYPANDLLRQPLWGFINLTSHELVARRQKALIAEIDHGRSEKLFTLFGRLLHHIQDMSTPSHVIPVYHAPGLADTYEDYLITDWGNLVRAHDPDWRDSQDSARYERFTDLYEAAAQATLKELAPSKLTVQVLIDGVATQADKSLFWKPHGQVEGKPPKHYGHGFGGFGILGMHFGDSSVQHVGDHTYHVEPEGYYKVASIFVHKAIVDSLAALRLFDALLPQNFKSS